MIGLESHRPDLIEYRECIDIIEEHVRNFTVAELETMNAREKQAGVTVLKWEDFQRTNHVGQQVIISAVEILNSFLGPKSLHASPMDCLSS